jgi:hypothetical protein
MTVFTGGQYFLDGRKAARGGPTAVADARPGPADGTSSAA